MKKYIALLLFCLVFSAACSQKDETAPSAADKAAVKYFGSYEGTMPCASCPGIETELILNPDFTFSLIELYLDGEKELVLTEGKWKLSDDMSYISLGYDEEDPPRLYYTAEDNDIVKLDIYAKPILSPLNYTLKRKE